AYAMTIEDREERNRAARAIIAIMGTLNPHLRDVNDFKHKLWDHLAVMSDFKLDIDSPYPTPEPSHFQTKPETVPYPQQSIRQKHYGKIVEEMLAKVAEVTDPRARELLIVGIANQMKKSYLVWNRDTVTDEEIFRDLHELSGGTVTVDPSTRLLDAKDLIFKSNMTPLNTGGKKKKQSRKK
ncbi:MAG: DUF4290 domain-containing protein, partial [Bacteroidales bacterium]|nr:DUF4290 domain-containing protein [Bacteroidales bacterium]